MKYWHITLVTILLISLPAVALTNYVITRTASEEIMDGNEAMMVGVAASLEVQLAEHLEQRQALLISLSELPGAGDDARAIVEDFYGGPSAAAERDRMTSTFETSSYGMDEGAMLLLMDPNHGAIVFCPRNPTIEGHIPLDADQVRTAQEAPGLTYLVSLPWEATPALMLSAPIRTMDGTNITVLGCLMSSPDLESVLVIHDDLGPGSGAYLVGPDHRLLTPSPSGGEPGDVSRSEGARKAIEGSAGFHVTEVSNPGEILEAYEHVEDWNLALVVEMDAATGMEGVSVVRLVALAAGAIVAGALIVISVVISKDLVRDLDKLVGWSKEVGDGNWDAPLSLGPTDEFKRLEVELHQMVKDLEKHQIQLRLAEHRFSNLFRNSLDPVYMAKADGVIVELNPAGERVLGLPKQSDSTYGHTLEDLFSSEEARKDFMGRLEREGAVAGYEAHFLLPSGREVFVLISATRRLDDMGRTVAYQGVIHDITDRKRFEEALVSAKNEAEFYCDIMSHDLNNAVQGLGGYLELCNLATCLEDVNEFLPYAHDQMARASDLLRNVRRLSHLGSQDVELRVMDLQKVLVKSVWAVERMHHHKTIDINVDIPPGSIPVKGEAFLEDVFINLLDNAIKYDSHEVKDVGIDVRRMERDGEAWWQVRISDRGHGIADRDKQTIFGRFERRALKEYGTGLGLSIVVKAVERSGGRVWVEDRVHGDHTQGSVFVVELLAGE